MSEGRWELLRGLGAALVTPPPDNAGVLAALGLPPQTAVEHTAVFVLSAPPHAAIHLGPEGKLGGDGLDRVAGFWRALGLDAPTDADHLGVLLMLCAELGEAGEATHTEQGRDHLRRTREVLLSEHLDSWAPGYLSAVADHRVGPITEWAHLVAATLDAERRECVDESVLPAALRDAPPALAAGCGTDELLDALVAPVRTGFVLTRPDVEACAAVTGLGLRRGERRFALKAMLEQDPARTLDHLAGHAERWAQVHARHRGPAAEWWTARAGATAEVLRSYVRTPVAGGARS